jgi:hypothetical protein
MADIAAADVTHLVLKQRKTAGSLNSNLVRLSFGDGALTYPAGGIPLSKAKMGCPVEVQSMVIADQGVSGYKFQYDQSNEKLVVMYGDYDPAAVGPFVEASTVAIPAQVIEVEVIGW